MSGGFYNIDCSLYGGSGWHKITRNPDEMSRAEKVDFCKPGIDIRRAPDFEDQSKDPVEPETKVDIDK